MMANMRKVMMLLITIFFTHPAAAVIVEGNFSGRFWDTWLINIELSPNTDFWSVETGWTLPFEGTFWYDTALAAPPVLVGDSYFKEASYSGPHNWLHGTLKMGGQEIAMTTGQPDPNGPKNAEHITLSSNLYNGHDEAFGFDYGDNYYAASSGRGGGFTISPYDQPFSFLSDFSLMQNFSLDGHTVDGIQYLGYMQFAEWGVVDGVEYEGFLSGEVNKFEIRVRVPEPSSLLLFLCILPLLILRFRMVSHRFSQLVSD
jgi:hypothetical protein